MTKSDIFIALINSTKRSDGIFQYVKKCVSNPNEFFNKKNLSKEWNSLAEEEKVSFSNIEKFFDLCVKYKMKTSTYQGQLYNTCKVCDFPVKFRNFQSGYDNFCCTDCKNKYLEITSYEKFGTKHPSQNSEVKKKLSESKIKLYKENKDKIINKQSKTWLKKYGVDNVSKSSYIQDKKKITCLKKYGVDHYSKTSEFWEKFETTCLEKYGVDHYSKTPEFREKFETTCEERYGNKHYFLTDDYKNKRDESYEKLYECRHPKQKYYKNFENFNVEFIINNFITNDGYIDVENAVEYFNVSRQTFTRLFMHPLLECGYTYKKKIANKKEKEFIDAIEKKLNKKIVKQFHIPGTRYKADGYDPDTNTIYEFLGDYWHGNPVKYDSEKMNEICKLTYGELYKITISRLSILKSLGFKIYIIWELNFKKDKLNGLEEF